MNYRDFEMRILNFLESFAMRRRQDGTWELDPSQFTHRSYDYETYYIFDEVGPVNPEVFSDPGPRYRVMPFFNYHTGPRDDGWRVVRTERNESVQKPPDATTGTLSGYITVDEAEKYLKGRLGDIERSFK